MPGASDIELLLCTIFNVKSTLLLTKEADVQRMGKSIPVALVGYIPVGNREFPDCMLNSTQLIRLVKDTNSNNQL